MTPREIAERHLRKWRTYPWIGWLDEVFAAACEEAAAEARRAEREACAQACETAVPGCMCEGDNAPCLMCAATQAADECADAIRARKEAE